MSTKITKGTVYHADHLPNGVTTDHPGLSYTYDWDKVTDSAALEARNEKKAPDIAPEEKQA